MRDLSFDMLYPAKIKLPERDASYLVLNCSYLPGYVVDRPNLISLLPPKEEKYLDSLITNRLFDGLFSILNESPYPGLRDAEYLEMRTSDTTGFLGYLSPEIISGICRDQNTDFIISFEYYSYNQANKYFYFSEDGNYQDLTEQNQKLFWRIYTRDGLPADEYIQMDTLLRDTPEYDDQNVNSIQLSENYIADAFREAGIRYGKRISPFWVNVNRIIYDIKMKTDSGYIDISEDKLKLRKLSSSDHKTKAYKACYNLAVLSESAGAVDDAITWIELALEQKNTFIALNYSNILKYRLLELDKLDLQTGMKK